MSKERPTQQGSTSANKNKNSTSLVFFFSSSFSNVGHGLFEFGNWREEEKMVQETEGEKEGTEEISTTTEDKKWRQENEHRTRKHKE